MLNDQDVISDIVQPTVERSASGGEKKFQQVGQIPGCLPLGYDLDSLLTPSEFCVWQRKTLRWFSARRESLPGVCIRSRKHVRIHPRTFIAKEFAQP